MALLRHIRSIWSNWAHTILTENETFEKFSNGPLIDVSVTKPWVLVYEIYFWILNISYVSPKQKLQNDHWPGCLNLELSGALHTSDYWKKMFFGNVQYLISSLPEWETPQYSEFRIEIRIYTIYVPYLDYQTSSFDVWSLPCPGNIRVAEFGKDQLVQKADYLVGPLQYLSSCSISKTLLPFVAVCWWKSYYHAATLLSVWCWSAEKTRAKNAKKSYFSICLAQEQAGVGLMWYARVSDVGEGIHCLRYIKAQSMAFRAKLWFCKANITSTYSEVVRLSSGRWPQLDSVTAPLFVFLYLIWQISTIVRRAGFNKSVGNNASESTTYRM